MFTTTSLLVQCFLAVALYLASESESRESDPYEGYKLFKVKPENLKDVKVLQNMWLTMQKLDFWAEPSRRLTDVTFTAPKEEQEEVRNKLTSSGLSYEESDLHIPQPPEEPVLVNYKHRRSDSPQLDLNQFNRLKQIISYLKDLASSCPQDINCSLYSIGKTHENRNIYVFKITKPGTTARKGIWVDSTTHAREWLSTATNLKILDQLVFRRDSNARRLVDSYDWYFVPVLNPDGYVFSFKQRLWRKNRRPSNDSDSIGVDLNRNFEFRWGREGVNHDPKKNTYCGPAGGSEPEVQAVQREARRLRQSLIGFVSIHCFGNMWMFPYGNTINHTGEFCERSNDHDLLMEVSNAAANAIEKTHNTNWERGTTCEVIYPNSGSSIDYVKELVGVKYAFALELRGDGFIVDATEIQPSFEEVWNGIVAMCDAISAQQAGQRF